MSVDSKKDERIAMYVFDTSVLRRGIRVVPHAINTGLPHVNHWSSLTLLTFGFIIQTVSERY